MPLTSKQKEEYDKKRAREEYAKEIQDNISYARKAERDENNVKNDMSGYHQSQRENNRAAREDNYASKSYPGHNRNILNDLSEFASKGPKMAKEISKGTDDVLNNLRKTMTKNPAKDGGYSSNPTGSGKGGKMDREWENHKWLSRKRNKDGKWIYDYGDGYGVVEDGKKGVSQQTKQNMQESAAKAPARNTGRKETNLLDTASKAVSDGASFINSFASSAIANTPLSKLFG